MASKEFFRHYSAADFLSYSCSNSPITGNSGAKSVSVPTTDTFSSQIAGFLAFSPEIEQVPAPNHAFSSFSPEFNGISASIGSFSPQVEGTPAYSPKFEEIPAFSLQIGGISLPINVFSPEISQVRSPIGMTGENTGIRVSEAVYLQELSRNQHKKTIDISVERIKSLRVRYYYGVIFLIMNFVAWIIRDYIQRVIPEDHFLRTCGIGGHDCIQTIGVLRISFGCFVNRGLLSSGIMAAYVVFLCWSAIRSEPAGDKCSPQKQANGHHDWMTVFSFFIGICAIVMATFSTGIDSESFQFRKVEVQEEDDIPYKYGFFHLVFSLGAMYFAMLFINWDLNSSTKKWSIDVGWASTWVKIINEWFAATIYMWKLISPVVRHAKIMDDGAMQPNQRC
uniref:Serine incorporator n=1 Tax=Chenopodium quinoa TaxID=63459 RepID=A0A803MVJ9_CHEQI